MHVIGANITRPMGQAKSITEVSQRSRTSILAEIASSGDAEIEIEI